MHLEFFQSLTDLLSLTPRVSYEGKSGTAHYTLLNLVLCFYYKGIQDVDPVFLEYFTYPFFIVLVLHNYSQPPLYNKA